MELENYIKNQIGKHIEYCNSIKEARSAFSVSFYHPKTRERITWSEKCALIDSHLDKTISKITKKLNKSSKDK